MSESTRSLAALHLVSAFMVLLGLVVLGLFVGQLLGLAAAYPLIGGGLAGITRLLTDAQSYGDRGRVALLIVQGVTSAVAFIVAPALHHWRFQRGGLWSVSPTPIRDTLELVWPIFLIPALAPLLELTITWNRQLSLPEALAPIEQWMARKEAELSGLTEFMIGFSDFGQFALGLLVVAALPAIGEELLFRGTLQPLVQRATGSPHRAIWITAIVFSAIHMQFYGFVPRMLLGVLFGYLYYWSGNLSIPILAHFANNGITVVLSYLHTRGNTDLSPDTLPSAPLPVLIASGVAGAALLYRFRQRYFLGREDLSSL